MYVYVYAYVCVFVCVDIWAYMCVHACGRVDMCVRACAFERGGGMTWEPWSITGVVCKRRCIAAVAV